MIAGRKIANEYLAIGTLLTTAVGAWAATGKKSPQEAVPTPSPDARNEDGFVRDYLIKKEREEVDKVKV